jgi:hypothetical protein
LVLLAYRFHKSRSALLASALRGQDVMFTLSSCFLLLSCLPSRRCPRNNKVIHAAGCTSTGMRIICALFLVLGYADPSECALTPVFSSVPLCPQFWTHQTLGALRCPCRPYWNIQCILQIKPNGMVPRGTRIQQSSLTLLCSFVGSAIRRQGPSPKSSARVSHRTTPPT